jgi:hypothetical protein
MQLKGLHRSRRVGAVRCGCCTLLLRSPGRVRDPGQFLGKPGGVSATHFFDLLGETFAEFGSNGTSPRVSRACSDPHARNYHALTYRIGADQ